MKTNCVSLAYMNKIARHWAPMREQPMTLQILSVSRLRYNKIKNIILTLIEL